MRPPWGTHWIAHTPALPTMCTQGLKKSIPQMSLPMPKAGTTQTATWSFFGLYAWHGPTDMEMPGLQHKLSQFHAAVACSSHLEVAIATPAFKRAERCFQGNFTAVLTVEINYNRAAPCKKNLQFLESPKRDHVCNGPLLHDMLHVAGWLILRARDLLSEQSQNWKLSHKSCDK